MRADWPQRRGLAYLAKAPVLPQAVLAVAGLATLRWWIEPEPRGDVVRALGLTVLGLGLISGPWIAVLSLKYGHLTISTAASINSSLVAPKHRTQLKHVSVRQLIKPAAGRLTAWEEPSQLGYERWNPLESLAMVRHQLEIVRFHCRRALRFLGYLDRCRLGLAALIAAFVGCWPWRERMRGERWRWSLIPAVAICAPYLPIWVELRYLYPLDPFLLVAAFHLARPAEVGWLGRRPAIWIGVWALIALSFAAPLVSSLRGLARPNRDDAWFKVVAAARALGVTGPVVGDSDTAMKVGFELGQIHAGTSVTLSAEEVGASDAAIVIVWRISTVASVLGRDATFTELELVPRPGVTLNQRAFVRRLPPPGPPAGSGRPGAVARTRPPIGPP